MAPGLAHRFQNEGAQLVGEAAAVPYGPEARRRRRVRRRFFSSSYADGSYSVEWASEPFSPADPRFANRAHRGELSRKTRQSLSDAKAAFFRS